MSVVAVAFASAVVTGDFGDIQDEFDVGEVVVALSVSLMVCGFGIGPLAWSPLVRFSYSGTSFALFTRIAERADRSTTSLDFPQHRLCHLQHPLCRREEHPDAFDLSILLRHLRVCPFDARRWHHLRYLGQQRAWLRNCPVRCGPLRWSRPWSHHWRLRRREHWLAVDDLGQHDLRGCHHHLLLHHPRDVRASAAQAPCRTPTEGDWKPEHHHRTRAVQA